jgi:hypothetical protein
LGAVDFGGGVLTSAGNTDIYVAKFDASGNHLWSQRFGDESDETCTNVAVDGAGNVLLTGYIDGIVDFGGGALTCEGSGDVFVAKFDPSGSHLWSQRFGDTNQQVGLGVAVDGSGDVLVTGDFVGTVDFGGGMLMSDGSPDIFVAKFDASGNHLWSRRFGDTDVQEGMSVAVDGAGNVCVTGYFYGAVDFGGGVLTSAGSSDIYVAKFDASGNHLWSQGFGDSDVQVGLGVVTDGAGSVCVTGYFDGAVDFGGGALTSEGRGDVFVAELDPSGSHLWSRRFGDAEYQQVGYSVAVDGTTGVVLTGDFLGTVDFGGGGLTCDGDRDIFIARFSLENLTDTGNGVPAWRTSLSQNFPNPFGSVTRIVFSLREAGEVSLRLYDAGGRLVRLLEQGYHEAGPHEARWDGRDGMGDALPTGVYFYRLSAERKTLTRKAVLLTR